MESASNSGLGLRSTIGLSFPSCIVGEGDLLILLDKPFSFYERIQLLILVKQG